MIKGWEATCTEKHCKEHTGNAYSSSLPYGSFGYAQYEKKTEIWINQYITWLNMI
jgi:hypothetical protein